jgi:hypothetical protein
VNGPDSWRVFYIPADKIPPVQFDTDLPLVLRDTVKADYDALRARCESAETLLDICYDNLLSACYTADGPTLMQIAKHTAKYTPETEAKS